MEESKMSMERIMVQAIQQQPILLLAPLLLVLFALRLLARILRLI
jgi:hypothetical protein